jgi:hypothetical protein
MNCLERDRGNIDQIDMPVQASVEAEVAEIGGHSIQVARVIAEHRKRDALLLCAFPVFRGRRSGISGGRSGRQMAGNVEHELIVAADVLAYKLVSDV